ncbi:MAG: hypothetical protein ABJE47_12090, partial [bacterium]
MTTAVLLFSALLYANPSPQSPSAPVPRDTVPIATDTSITGIAPAVSIIAQPGSPLSRGDTVRRRPKAIEVSDAYALRLRIHHYSSFAMLPLFALQSISGNQLYQSGGEDPSWAKSTHSVSAFGLGTVFTVNTVTGLWNLWDSRGTPDGRVKRWLHSGLLLASDAGFAY